MTMSDERQRGSRWDTSIIGVTVDEMAAMDEIERTERGIDEINRAADILREVVTAFGDTMRPHERSALLAASRDVITVARELDKAVDVARERESE